MFKPNRKILITVLFFLAVASISFVVYKTRMNKQGLSSEKFEQNLNIPNYFSGAEHKIENNIKRSDFKFPQSLPYLKQIRTSPINITEAKKIASTLDLTEDPLIITGISNETSFIWNGEKYSLIVTQNTSLVEVYSSVSIRILIENRPNEKMSNDEFYTSIAQDFLTDKIGVDSSDLKFSGFSYFNVRSGVESLVKGTKGDADIIQLNYHRGSSSLPILTTNPDESQIYIQLLRDGTVVSVKANLGSDLQPSENQYPLKNFDQFSKEIGNSIIVSLNDNNINLPDLSSDSISNIQANKVSLAYLLSDSKETVVQPVYLIEGIASVKGFNSPVSIFMYLPAFEGFTQP